MENQQATAQQKSLTLLNMSSAFLIFGLGITMATLVFLIELIYKRFQDNYFIFDNKIYPRKVQDRNQSKSDDDEKDQTDINESSTEDQSISEGTVSVSDESKQDDETRVSPSDDVKIGNENVILIEVKIHNDDKIIAGPAGGKSIDRKPVRQHQENFDEIEIEELLN